MKSPTTNAFGSLATLSLSEGATSFYRLHALEEQGLASLDRLPFSIRILLENALRHAGGGYVSEEDVRAVAAWSPTNAGANVPFLPTRVVLQDFTGVPAVVDLAAMRSGIAAMGGDPERINPVVPADLVIDHSVQVDYFGSDTAYRRNVEREMERNWERYALLRWAQDAFRNFRVVPPGTGIVHQVNLEYLASVVERRRHGDVWVACPDTLVGTDSHTTMINGLGVVGWGVGGIEAEAVLLGQPYYMLLPEVVGVRFTGALQEGATATDLVLAVTEKLRAYGVVARFVEYFGSGLSTLSLADRATIANMSPEYGATIGFFPVDDGTLEYLRGTGRPSSVVERVERYNKAQGLFRTDETPDPEYTARLEIDLSTVEPSVAGPKRPQDRIALTGLRSSFRRDLPGLRPGIPLPQANGGSAAGGAMASANGDRRRVEVELETGTAEITDGTLVIAAITSCTNTSNPSVMVGAGLLARNAVARGLAVPHWVKTSMAPGSKVVSDYLDAADLTRHLDALGFNVVGYGCTTCIGNSGPLPDPIISAVENQGLVVTSALSGNRNFEARIHQQIRGNYLASPILVVAFALAGRIDIDFAEEPLGTGTDGEPVFLADVWPAPEEIRDTVQSALRPEMYESRYAEVFEGDDLWKSLAQADSGGLYDWNPASTYIRLPPFFQGMSTEAEPFADVERARVLAVLGDTTTTDHISPAGAIPRDGSAGRFLQDIGVKPWEFNTFGARRGNHEVMMRGTFANVRIRNLLLDDTEGGYTVHHPTGEVMSIYDAAMRYRDEGTPLVVLAGKEYGTGSSRDWAAKGTSLLGVRAVIAESYERIHRSNLVGMGVLPLQFKDGEGVKALGLTGRETFRISGVADGVDVHELLAVTAEREDGSTVAFEAIARLDSAVDVEYYRNAGILHTVLRRMARGEM
ncbi:MAG: aconitate hydratase AcnA [Gammaproteobacteria bacterium]|nr:aconitate hydratase AcnA [Gammaproteobacteria bacterium]MDE0259660.1 aconitate hydratase AcnA [Gammaproteobacteria bacterium]